MYKLFTDKSELFECDIKLEGASLSKSSARLVVETSNYSLLFKGNINSSGKCEIPIRKLKGLIDENTKGNIRLEVIAEDTYFIFIIKSTLCINYLQTSLNFLNVILS